MAHTVWARHLDIARRCEPFLPPGTVIRHVFGARPYPVLLPGLVRLPLAVLLGDRIVAVTDDAIHVLRASPWRTWRPTRLLRTLPRNSRLGPIEGMFHAPIRLGGETLRVPWSFYPAVEAADLDLPD
jgi:hypothetical protein